MPNSKEFTQMTYIKILIGVIVLYIVYFYLFSFSQVYNNQDGSLILKDPIKLNEVISLLERNESIKRAKESHVHSLLLYHELLKELKGVK